MQNNNVSNKFKKYLKSTEIINWTHPDILTKAKELSSGTEQLIEIAKRSFEWVRDEILHTSDHNISTVTCRASDVLKYRTGFCYGKSHLLAALLRANSIPAGLCYQRLCIKANKTYCLHGLNAVYLDKFGWYRVDSRGNKEGVNAQFIPPLEQIAFPIQKEGEADFHEIWFEPLPIIVELLQKYSKSEDVLNNLPDLEIASIRT
ncbi:MAG: transglutaminase family protein [Desulfobacterales bacterium]|nr:transglutaminase family protein [Desulfobacterales bacterium]